MARAWLIWIAAWAIVVLILAGLCAVQEIGPRKVAESLGWRGWLCLAAVVVAVFLLIIGISI